jgi:hypothetical protein
MSLSLSLRKPHWQCVGMTAAEIKSTSLLFCPQTVSTACLRSMAVCGGCHLAADSLRLISVVLFESITESSEGAMGEIQTVGGGLLQVLLPGYPGTREEW